MRLLAGDLGGTKCNLGVYEVEGDGEFRLVQRAGYASQDHPHLRDILRAFLEEVGGKVDAGAMGVPGAVYRGRADLVNLDWSLDAAELREILGQRPFHLMNDLEAFAWGIPGLGAEDVERPRLGHPVVRRPHAPYRPCSYRETIPCR